MRTGDTSAGARSLIRRRFRARNFRTVWHTVGDIGVVVLSPGLGGVAVRSFSHCPAEVLVEFG
jgi:hypothetical protein